MPQQVLFVCLGNICRSPTAHGVFARQVAEAGSLLNIDVLDHIVLARNGFASLRERHLGFPEE